MPAAEEAYSSAQRQSTEPRSADALVLRITPMGAFAAGALVVSALALAVAIGRRHPLNNPGNPPAVPRVSAESLEDIRNSNPIGYETLQVDRGTVQ